MSAQKTKLQELTETFESMDKSWREIEKIRPEQIGTGGVKEVIEYCKKARDEAERAMLSEKQRVQGSGN